MRRIAILIVAFLVVTMTAGNVGAGIDQVFTKPKDKPSWGEIFNWAMGAGGFDKSYALVIGISEYPGDFETLRSTKNDPIRMKDFLLDEAGFDHVHVLTDEKAHINRIRQLMEGKFPRLVNRDDRFLFYWSGHGTQVEDALGRTVGYLPLGNSKRDESWTMISMVDVTNWDRWIKAEHVLFLLDACFSGLAGSETKATPKDYTIERLSRPAHHLVSAGTGDQQTIASERWQGSIFTDSIIRAARGEADAQTAYPRDGVVNLAEMLAFVRQRIDHERRGAGWDKAITPQWNHLRSNKGEFFFVTKAKKFEVAKLEGETTGEIDSGKPVIEMKAGGGAATVAEKTGGTQQALVSPISPERVKQAQEMLVVLGFKPGTSDGVLGVRTRAAIIAFQRSIGTKVTGELTEADEIKLAMAYANRIASGGSPGLESKVSKGETQVAVVAAPTPIVDIVPTDKVLVAERISNVHAGPTVESDEIGRLRAGATVDVTGQTTVSGSTWYRVALAGGATGFVFGDLLKEAPTPPVTPAVGTYATKNKAGDAFRDCPDCPEMVVVPAGSFMMGSPESEKGRNYDEGPQREVKIPRSFAVGKYEVTFDEWEACLADGGCNGYRPNDAGWGRGPHPVIYISRDDAKAYVDWLSQETGKGYRLLTEAEWEYAARSGTTTRYSFGYEVSREDANFGRNMGKTTRVGRYPANRWKLHDMHGNVWEWVEDCSSNNYDGAPIDGSAWSSGDCSHGVLRGGSWVTGPRVLRSALRGRYGSGARSFSIGFRVARTLP